MNHLQNFSCSCLHSCPGATAFATKRGSATRKLPTRTSASYRRQRYGMPHEKVYTCQLTRVAHLTHDIGRSQRSLAAIKVALHPNPTSGWYREKSGPYRGVYTMPIASYENSAVCNRFTSLDAVWNYSVVAAVRRFALKHP